MSQPKDEPFKPLFHLTYEEPVTVWEPYDWRKDRNAWRWEEKETINVNDLRAEIDRLFGQVCNLESDLRDAEDEVGTGQQKIGVLTKDVMQVLKDYAYHKEDCEVTQRLTFGRGVKVDEETVCTCGFSAIRRKYTGIK